MTSSVPTTSGRDPDDRLRPRSSPPPHPADVLGMTRAVELDNAGRDAEDDALVDDDAGNSDEPTPPGPAGYEGSTTDRPEQTPVAPDERALDRVPPLDPPRTGPPTAPVPAVAGSSRLDTAEPVAADPATGMSAGVDRAASALDEVEPARRSTDDDPAATVDAVDPGGRSEVADPGVPGENRAEPPDRALDATPPPGFDLATAPPPAIPPSPEPLDDVLITAEPVTEAAAIPPSPEPLDDVLITAEPVTEAAAAPAHPLETLDDDPETIVIEPDDEPDRRTEPPPRDLSPTEPAEPQIELRQIAGLTAGMVMPLEDSIYDFAEDGEVRFALEVEDGQRVIVHPGTAAVAVDTVVVREPTTLGRGALDVGSARFVVGPRRERRRATDWLDRRDVFERDEPVIHVPPDLEPYAPVAPPVDDDPKPRRRRKGKRHAEVDEQPEPARPLSAAAWELVDRVRAIRAETAERERYFHPDPAEMMLRADNRAPILGVRPPGHPLFAQVALICADMPWMPHFDDIHAVPDTVGEHLRPLMSLPSVPVPVDLTVGPLGIVGSRKAVLACARYALLSLYGSSSTELRLRLDTGFANGDEWAWAEQLCRPGALDDGFTVSLVDGMVNFPVDDFSHHDALEVRVGLIVLAETIDELPVYCGSVLQVDDRGTAILTNHLGHAISGSSIGVSWNMADRLASKLASVMARRRSR